MRAADDHGRLAAPPGPVDALRVTRIEARGLETQGAKAVRDEKLPGRKRACTGDPAGNRPEGREPPG